MARVALLGGAYTAKSIIANAQRCVNLYPESNPQPDQAPVPVTHYLTPGLVTKLAADGLQWRQTYRASNGDFYAVLDSSVYYISPANVQTLLGTIGTTLGTVSFADNGLVIVLVDGSPNGYAINMANRSFGKIVSPAFYGADRADYVDTFLLFNRPGTQQFYISLSEASFDMLVNSPISSGTITANGAAYTNGLYIGVPLTGGTGSGAIANIQVQGGVVVGVNLTKNGKGYSIGDNLTAAAALIGGTGHGFVFQVLTAGAFDPLDIAAKVGYPDLLASLIVMHREIWLIGTLTTEIWYNSGAADFTFQQMPGSFIEHGCVAKYTICKEDLSVFWLSQDEQGQAIFIQGTNYAAKRVSTHAIENEWSKYPTVSDAIAFTYQQEGHVFVQVVFPTADKAWNLDLATMLWHERTWTDDDGLEHRHRANCGAFAYGVNYVGDWGNGKLYAYDLGAYDDDGQPIVRRRGFPHTVSDGKRIFYRQFIADMAVGNGGTVYLRWSDTRGATWSDPISNSMGEIGEFLTQIQFQRLGMARDRIFELFWSDAVNTALNGAWVDTKVAGT